MTLHIFSPYKRETVFNKKVTEFTKLRIFPNTKVLIFPLKLRLERRINYLNKFCCVILETKKRSNFLCSIICCFGKKSTKYKNGKKDRGSFSMGKGKGIGGSGASGSGDLCLEKQNSQSKSTKQLLPEIRSDDVGKKCIVIDLDETLVHSSFKVK